VEVERPHSPDAVISAVPDGWPEPAPIKGRTAVMLQFIRLHEDSEEHAMEIEQEVAQGAWVIVDARWEMRGTSSGVKTRTNIAHAYRLDQMTIAEARFYWEWQDALEAVGAAE
jgi:ketosteroid isomerase-like protein